MATTTTVQKSTDAKFKEITFKWTIRNLGNLKSDLSLYSDSFETGNVNWQAVFKCVEGKPMIGLKFLGCSVLGPCFSMPVEYNCYNNNKCIIKTISRVFSRESSEECEDLGEDTSKVVSEANSLTLTFYITTRKLGNFIIPPSTVLQDLDPDVKNREYTTIDFMVGNPAITVKAHKEILAARSPVFAAMFVLAENQDKPITISDMDKEVFKQLLKYMYTDRADLKKVSAERLLPAADKYELKRLKAACEFAIFTKASNGIFDLMFADKHNAQQLKAHMLEFIAANADNEMRKDAWETLDEKYPHLVLEVLQSIANISVKT